MGIKIDLLFLLDWSILQLLILTYSHSLFFNHCSKAHHAFHMLQIKNYSKVWPLQKLFCTRLMFFVKICKGNYRRHYKADFLFWQQRRLIWRSSGFWHYIVRWWVPTFSIVIPVSGLMTPSPKYKHQSTALGQCHKPEDHNINEYKVNQL
jgi:hypothetical protein